MPRVVPLRVLKPILACTGTKFTPCSVNSFEHQARINRPRSSRRGSASITLAPTTLVSLKSISYPGSAPTRSEFLPLLVRSCARQRVPEAHSKPFPATLPSNRDTYSSDKAFGTHCIVPDKSHRPG